MPTYVYRCPNGHSFERREPVSASHPERCEQCDAEATRQLQPTPFVFKGI